MFMKVKAKKRRMEQLQEHKGAKGRRERELLWLVEWDSVLLLIEMAGRVARAWSCLGAVVHRRNPTTVAGSH